MHAARGFANVVAVANRNASTTVLWHGGRFLAHDEPRAHVALDDRGYLLGDGVFATMRGYDGVCFRAAAHLADLARGADLFDLALPLAQGELAALCDEAAIRTGAADAYVRVTLTRGPRLSILARALEPPSDEDYARGVAAVIVGARRIPPECLDPTVKTTSYAPALLARREATARGAAEGIQLSIGGDLACGAMANLFVVSARTLLTPSLASGCRNGITRRAVLEIASRAGLDARETRLSPAELARADEAFFTSTRVECLPIASVDGARIGAGTHVRTAAVRAALRDLVAAEARAEAAPRAAPAIPAAPPAPRRR